MPTAKTQRDWERLKDRFIGEKRKVTCTADEEKEIWKLYKEGIDKVTAKSGPTGQQALV